MSRLLKTVLALSSAPANARRRGHSAVAKKMGATWKSRHESDGAGMDAHSPVDEALNCRFQSNGRCYLFLQLFWLSMTETMTW